jgi:hypothetical protein
MLVLALQFSKGSERGRTHDGSLNRSPLAEPVVRGAPWAAGAMLHASAEVEETPIGSAPSKQKRRQGQPMGNRNEETPTNFDYCSTDPPMHQLGTGTNRVGRMPTNGCTVAP